MTIPEGWTVASLHEVAEIVLGQSPPGASLNARGLGVPFFQGKADFGDVLATVREWTTEPRKHARGGDVLLAVRAPVGPTNLAPCDCAIGRGIAALRGAGLVDNRYLLWALRLTSPALAADATGSTFDAVTGAQVRRHRIPVAPLSEQPRIVAAIEEHFSRLDAAERSIAAASRRLSHLGGAVSTSTGDWPLTTLGAIAEVTGGVTKDSKRQGDQRFVEVPYLRVANVQRGYLDLSSVTTIRVAPEKAATLALQPGDVLFNEGGDRDKLGRGWVWSGEIDGCIHQNHVFRARLHDGYDPRFVSWHGNTFGRAWFEAAGRQTTNLASLNLTTLKRFPVPNAPLDEQRRIVAELERVQSLVASLGAAIVRTRRRSAGLRRAILERAFRGKLVHSADAI